MSLQACAELVARGDPDRFLAAMTGSEAARARLFPIYAFNLEIARAGFASAEPLVARMRLQFWSDTVDEIAAGQVPGRHEVATALAEVVQAAGLPAEPFHQMIAARIDEAEQVLVDVPDFTRRTAGNLMLLSGRALGADAGADQALTGLGQASGLANWLLALPALAGAGRGFSAPAPEAITDLSRQGLELLAQARKAQALRDPALLPALRAAWRAGPVLKRAGLRPQRALQGALEGPEITRRGALVLRSLSKRW